MSGPIPARVDGAAKAALLGLIDDAVRAGWSLTRACAALEADRARVWRRRQRRAAGRPPRAGRPDAPAGPVPGGPMPQRVLSRAM